ncbi:TlpA family protein disulfide reductase [Chitinophaga sp. YR627]|uniref:TlpA family protein disulfide reductase n=1 Tax=Chitinophaga sp. YR627 TaxID=1881041 RepID=UPI0015A52134|nr:TlpA disulfide reductase family protein [Chitinophaga sp. YR627]
MNTAGLTLKIVYNMPYGRQEQTVVTLDSTGHFKAAILLFNPQELMLFIEEDAMIMLYGLPGKRLSFTLSAKDIKRIKSMEDMTAFHVNQQVIAFSGDVARINRDYHDYMYRLNKVVSPMSNYVERAQPVEEYLKWRVRKMNEQLDSLQQLRKQLHPLFYTRTFHFIRYNAGADVLAYWLEKDKQERDMPVSYQQFIATLPVNNDEAVQTAEYYEFINNYLVYLQVKGGEGQGVHKLSYIAQQVPKGTGQNLLLDNESQDSIHRGLPLHPATLRYLSQLPGNGPLAKQLSVLNSDLTRSMSNAMPDKATLLAASADTSSDILQQLGVQYKGKVVYVDFWGTWCLPCLEEMKVVPEVKKVFEGQPVVFLYLAVHSDQDAWEKMIRKEQIQGEHYRLTDKEFDRLNKRISVTSFPRYLLIDKNGTITHVNAPRPSDVKALASAINGLLN